MDWLTSILGLASTYYLSKQDRLGWVLKILACLSGVIMNIQFGLWGMLPFSLVTLYLSGRAWMELRPASCGYFNGTVKEVVGR